MAKAFVSYVRENGDLVERLCRDLTRQGISVWRDQEQILPGQRWRQVIKNAINNGDFFIACFSKEYQERSCSYMNEEMVLAIEELRKRPIERIWFIPVMLSRCSLPERSIGGGEMLSDLHCVELFKDWGDGVDLIVRSILSTSSVVNQPRQNMMFGIGSQREESEKDKLHQSSIVLSRSASEPKSLFWEGDSQAHEKMLTYKNELDSLRGDFEARTAYPNIVSATRRKARELSHLIESMPDDRLYIGWRLIKYEYAGWASLIAARSFLESFDFAKAERIGYCKDAASRFKVALALMSEVEEGFRAGDARCTPLYEWMISKGENRNWVLYLLAIALALHNRLGGPDALDEVMALLSQIPSDYLSRFPVESDENLEWIRKRKELIDASA